MTVSWDDIIAVVLLLGALLFVVAWGSTKGGKGK